MQPKPFLTAEWRFLAMANYEIDPAILQPFVPSGTELDQWQGRTYVSLVGFLFANTRVLGLPIPWHRNFAEFNLRFYVRRRTNGTTGEWRRGVVFLKEIVPRWAIATVARLAYNENYVARPMRHSLTFSQTADSLQAGSVVEYGWREGRNWQRLALTLAGQREPLVPGSEAEFITEHYWGYSAQKDGGCVEYQVEHPSWNIWPVNSIKQGGIELECDAALVYGQPFAQTLQAQPASAFVADGSAIVVRKGVRIC